MHTQKLPKRNPNFPTLITWTDPTGKLHVPPDPPLREGYCPPWLNLPNEYPRKQHLKKCPSAKCRRARRCVDPHVGGFCQITHMTAGEFRANLADRIDRLLRDQGIEPAPPPLPGEITEPPPASLKRELQAACDAKEREALLKFQTDWINEQKRKFAARESKHAKPHPSLLGEVKR